MAEMQALTNFGAETLCYIFRLLAARFSPRVGSPLQTNLTRSSSSDSSVVGSVLVLDLYPVLDCPILFQSACLNGLDIIRSEGVMLLVGVTLCLPRIQLYPVLHGIFFLLLLLAF